MMTKSRAPWSGRLLTVFLLAAVPGTLTAQYAPQRITPSAVFAPFTQADTPPSLPPLLPALEPEDDDFTFMGLIAGTALGAALGGATGYLLDTIFDWTPPEDAGFNGLVVGVVIGGTVGAIRGGHRSSWPR